MKLTVAIAFIVFAQLAFAAHDYKEIDTCYHWLQKWQLDAKIKFAKNNDGKLYFHRGQVIYCWRTPLGAQNKWEDHGDFLIRIKFKKRIKIAHAKRQVSIGETLKYGEVIYSNDKHWQEYTITPDAVESWSAYHPRMVQEMKAELLSYQQPHWVDENDLFYARRFFDLKWINKTMPKIINAHEDASSESMIFGNNSEEHFETNDEYNWNYYIDKIK